MQLDMPQFGIDWDGPFPLYKSDNVVDVPETPCPLDTTQFEELMRTVPPLSESTTYGIDLYEQTLEYVTEKLALDVGSYS